MAVLDATDRATVSGRAQREWIVSEAGTLGITAAQFLTVIGDLDTFLDTNATALNNAIQQPMRGILSAKAKARILIYVISQRYLRSP